MTDTRPGKAARPFSSISGLSGEGAARVHILRTEETMSNRSNENKNSRRTKLLLHHLRPAATAFAVGVGASFAATLLRTVFTQVIRYTVDGVLLGETAGLPAWLAALEPGKMLAVASGAAALVAILEFVVGFMHYTNLSRGV